MDRSKIIVTNSKFSIKEVEAFEEGYSLGYKDATREYQQIVLEFQKRYNSLLDENKPA